MNRLDALLAEQTTFADLLLGADLDTPVPACAPWRVRDLAAHLTGVHRWAAATSALAPDEAVPADDPGEPDPGDDPATAYRRAAATLHAAVRSDPDRPCPTLSGPGAVAWWTRRQLHETLVHRLDLQAAVGHDHPVDPDVAADCVAEVVEVLHPRQVRLGRAPAPSAGIDLAGRWTLGAPRVVARVDGEPHDLALLLWRRTTLDPSRFTVSGDTAAVRALLADALTP